MLAVTARFYLGGAALTALFALGLGPGCGGRAGSCPGFDSCQDASPCPLARCVCDDGEQEFPAACGTDGTCFTVSDCAALCVKRKSKCSKPPAACDVYLATECQCSATKTHFAEAWDCVQGKAPAITAKDCDDACGTQPGSGGSGGGGVGGGFPVVTSSAVSSSSGL